MKVISSGAIGHLCGTPTVITTLPPSNSCRRLASFSAPFFGVEELRILRQARITSSGTMREPVAIDQQVVIVGLAALGLDLVVVELEFLDRIDVEVDARLEQAGLVAIQRVRRDAARLARYSRPG